MRYPDYVELCEVGPRDGFQFEKKDIPFELKVQFIRKLVDSGLPRIQITSFVDPKRVPQMADAERIVEALSDVSDCMLSGLALNVKGVIRAAACGLKSIDLSIATNEKHGSDNANMSVEEGVLQAGRMIRSGLDAGMQVQLNLQTVWGYQRPDDTPLEDIRRISAQFAGAGLESFSLADSTGLANPESIRRVVLAVRCETDVPIVLHLHDTRGLGIANIVAAIESGVSRFDTSLGGLGGCPFIPWATGNVATEDVLYLLDSLGISHSTDSARVAAVAQNVASYLEKDLSGKMYRLLA